MASDNLTVMERLAYQPVEEKLLRNRLIEEGVPVREATRRAAVATGRLRAPSAAASHAAPARPAPVRINETAHVAAAAKKRARKAAKESARAARIAQVVTEAMVSARQVAAPQVPAAPLHTLRVDELDRVAADTPGRRPADAASPYWNQEAAPAAPVRESAPAFDLSAVTEAELTKALSEMSSEEWESAGARLFLGHSRQGRPGSFWQAA